MSSEYEKRKPDTDGALAEMAAQCARVREMAVRQSARGEAHAKRVIMEARRHRKPLILVDLHAEPQPQFRGGKAFEAPLPPEVAEAAPPAPEPRPEPGNEPKTAAKAKSFLWPWR